MEDIEPINGHLQPIRKSVTVERSAEEAFRLFTAGIATWWPKTQYSISQARIKDVVLEPQAGGAIYEVRDDGEAFPWGKVLTWEPPDRLVLAWHPGRDPAVAQEVEIRFRATPGGGTHVELEHRNWDRLGDEAPDVRSRYAGGWEHVLGTCFVNACAS